MSLARAYEDFEPQGPRRRGGSDQTTERLLEAATAEFIAHGYDASRVSTIARRAGLTSGAVYARWPSKTDVMVAAVDRALQQITPQRRLEELDALDLEPSEMMAVLAANLFGINERREVLVHVFGAARNSEELGKYLQEFLDEVSGQVYGMVEVAKDRGLCDPGLSTAAITLFSAAIGIGTVMLMSTKLDKRFVPSEDEWNALIERIIHSVAPPAETAS